MDKVLTIFSYVFSVLATALSYTLRGLVLGVLWGWFIVPIFGSPSLKMFEAIGIVLVVSFLTHQGQHYKASSQEEGYAMFKKAFLGIFLSPAITLGLGWILHKFM